MKIQVILERHNLILKSCFNSKNRLLKTTITILLQMLNTNRRKILRYQSGLFLHNLEIKGKD